MSNVAERFAGISNNPVAPFGTHISNKVIGYSLVQVICRKRLFTSLKNYTGPDFCQLMEFVEFDSCVKPEFEGRNRLPTLEIACHRSKFRLST